jgi:hypothetical protein
LHHHLLPSIWASSCGRASHRRCSCRTFARRPLTYGMRA